MDSRSMQGIYMVCPGYCEGPKVGGANTAVGKGCLLTEEMMLESYWGFHIHQEDSGRRAFLIPGMLWTQEDSQQELSLPRGESHPRGPLPPYSASEQGFVLCRGWVFGHRGNKYLLSIP